MSHVDHRIDALSAALRGAGVPHECYHDCVMVRVPGSVVEVKFWSDGSESIQMIPGDFHTHLSVLAVEEGLDEESAFAAFMQKVLSGEFPVIEEVAPSGTVRMTIERSLEEYLKYLPEGTTYRVRRET